MDVDQVTGNLGPVTGNDRSIVASGILGYLCPCVGTGDYPDPGSSDMRHKIVPPAGQVTEPCIPGESDPAAGDQVFVHG